MVEGVPLRVMTGNNHADQSVITGAQVSTLPLANLLDDDIGLLWRSNTDIASQGIVADIGKLARIGVVAFVNSNAVSPPTQFTVRVSTTDPTGLTDLVYEAFPLGIPDMRYNKFIHFIEPVVVGRYVRISHVNLPGFPEAGRLVIADVWAPSHNMQFGREKLWRDFSVKSRSLGGNPYVDVNPRQRGWRATVTGLTEAEAQSYVDELNRLRGIGRDILLSVDRFSDNPGRDTVRGLLEEPVRQRQLRHGYEIDIEVWDRI